MRPNMRPMEKTDLKGALNDLSTDMRKSLGVVVLALVLAALSAVLTIIGPDQVGKIATIMSDGLLGGIDLAAIARVGILLAVIYGLSALFGFIQHYIMASVTLKMSYRIRAELSEKINRVPQKYFNFHAQGDILSRITNDVSTLQQGLTNSLPTIISAATQFLGCLIMMFVTEWRLALVSLGITLVGLLLVVFIMSRSQKYFNRPAGKPLASLNGYVEEMYSGHEVVRISRAAEPVGKTFDTLNDAVYDANWRSQFLSGVMQPLMNVIGNLSYVAVCVLGCDSRNPGNHRYRRDRFVHSVCASVHLPADPDCAGHDESADGIRLGTPDLRLPRQRGNAGRVGKAGTAPTRARRSGL